jgi:tRNA U34 5-methylaminomethyl-2-thiouridine-forming methyltransferase MnmC
MSDPIESHLNAAPLGLIKTADGSLTLKDGLLEESYRSEFGAASESFHVYLKNSGVYDQLIGKDAAKDSDCELRLLEYGFGTGLNYLLTASLATTQRKRVEYVALEKLLLSDSILDALKLDLSVQHCEAITARCPPIEIARQYNSLLEWRRALPDVPQNGTYSGSTEFVNLKLIIGPAEHYKAEEGKSFDAIYFDPFSPKSSPELWTASVLEQAFRSLKPGGTLTTYCVAGDVRRALTKANFEVHRLPGPTKGKRQVLLAVRPTI